MRGESMLSHPMSQPVLKILCVCVKYTNAVCTVCTCVCVMIIHIWCMPPLIIRCVTDAYPLICLSYDLGENGFLMCLMTRCAGCRV